MTSSRTILKNLKNLNQYLAQLHRSQQSTCFERLVSEAFSNILYLPFYSSDNDVSNIPHRVTWQGSIGSVCKAPQQRPDSIARCCNFYLLIEATLKTGANQWSQEFAASIRHCEDFIRESGAHANEVYIVLVTPQLHRDTYRSINRHPRQEYSFIPIETSIIAKILETSLLAFTMRHLELRRLLNQISDYIRTPSPLDAFRNTVDSLLTNWQKDVLKVEKNAFVGVKSYEAMRRINRTHIGASEILKKLQRHPIVNKYLKIIGDKLSFDIIEESLIQQSLASQLSLTYEGEKLFSPVPFADFRERGLRLIRTVEGING